MERYHRQMLLAEVGEHGQQRLRDAHAVVIGCGALGTVACDALCRAGVGRLTIVDRDVVELTNLQRQVLFDENDVGEAKAEAARRRLERINADVRIDAHVMDCDHRTVEGLLGDDVGVILDGTDNFETRYLLNDVAVKHGVPLTYAGVVGVSGRAMTILPGNSACVRCLFPEPPAPGSQPTCDTAGVLGPVAGMVAQWQACEALKILIGARDTVTRGLVSFEPWTGRVRTIETQTDPMCPCCASKSFEFLDGERASTLTNLCGRGAVQVSAREGDPTARLDLGELAGRLRGHGEVVQSAFLVRATLDDELGDIGTPIELTVFRDGRAIVKGTTKQEAAKLLYAKYVGA
ncbi:MAG: ThiF family adenylyltransferase [Planctomycetota bacterium]